MSNQNIFLACPLYDGRLYSTTARSLFQTASRVHRVHVVTAAASLLASNCNGHWCTALNHRAAQQLKWFAMLHSDIEPEPWWLDKLIAEAEQHQADLVSAIVPMKDLSGLTSTALARPDSEWEIFCRLTMQQVHSPLFPDTFDTHQAVAALAILPKPQRVIAPPPEKTSLLLTRAVLSAVSTAPGAKKCGSRSRTASRRTATSGKPALCPKTGSLPNAWPPRVPK